MEKLKINVNIVTDSFICTGNKHFIFFTPRKNNYEKFFSINEQSNITNINSELGYLDKVKQLDENFLNLKQYKLEFFSK